MTILTIGTSFKFLSQRFQWFRGQKPPKNGKKSTFDHFTVILEIRLQRQSILRAKIGGGDIFRVLSHYGFFGTTFNIANFDPNQIKVKKKILGNGMFFPAP